MADTISGSCLCGFIKYEYKGTLGTSSYCHCDDCKKATGGPYTVGVRAEKKDFYILEGKTKRYTTIGDSGNQISRDFCPECGSPIFTEAEVLPGLIFIKSGSLDHPEILKPSSHTWIGHSVPWAFIEEGLPEYEDNGE